LSQTKQPLTITNCKLSVARFTFAPRGFSFSFFFFGKVQVSFKEKLEFFKGKRTLRVDVKRDRTTSLPVVFLFVFGKEKSQGTANASLMKTLPRSHESRIPYFVYLLVLLNHFVVIILNL
jgi:hypothetical protein